MHDRLKVSRHHIPPKWLHLRDNHIHPSGEVPLAHRRLTEYLADGEDVSSEV